MGMLIRFVPVFWCFLFLQPTKSVFSSICGRQKLLAGFQAAYLSSPNWPLKYPSNMDCFYVIQPVDEVNKPVVLELRWIEFDILGHQGSCEDFISVKIGNDSRKNFTFCSKDLPHRIFSPSGTVVLHFHSGQRGNGKGFKASFRLVDYAFQTSKSDICGGKITSKIPRGLIQSPNWPRSASPCSCVFQFSLEANEQLHMNIMDFPLRNSRSECKKYNSFIEIRASSKEHASFYESCSMFSLSVCQGDKKWSVTVDKRTVYVHLNLLQSELKSRGFMAGYIIQNKKSIEHRRHRSSKVFNVIFIGAISGILIAGLIVAMTSLGVHICLKKGMV